MSFDLQKKDRNPSPLSSLLPNDNFLYKVPVADFSVYLGIELLI
jgi:hypothetical protein